MKKEKILKTISNNFFLNAIIVFSLVVFSFGCSNKQNYAGLVPIIQKNDCSLALQEVAKTKESYGKNSEILFFLDSAMVNFQCNNFDESNVFFHNAEQLAEKLYTESVSKNLFAFVSNDLNIPYAGEDFERVLINLFSAIAYIELGERDEALVECRRLNTLLNIYNSKYKDKKNAYKEDAFARYLSGILYESSGQYDDAYIDYKKAYKTYLNYNKFYGTRPPLSLKKDLYRVSYLVGRDDEFKNLFNKKDKLRILKEDDYKRKGKIVFIHLNGLAPVKKDKVFLINSTAGPISIAFPEYRSKTPLYPKEDFLLIKDDKSIKVVTELAEDIDKIAIHSLKDRKARIWAKSVARAVTKQIAIQATSKGLAGDDQNGALASVISFGLNAANSAFLEKADTRSWQSLPSKIYIGVKFVEPGSYDISLQNCLGSHCKKNITIKKGETKYIIHHTMF